MIQRNIYNGEDNKVRLIIGRNMILPVKLMYRTILFILAFLLACNDNPSIPDSQDPPQPTNSVYIWKESNQGGYKLFSTDGNTLKRIIDKGSNQYDLTDNGLLFFYMMKSYSNAMDKGEYFLSRLDNIDTLNPLKISDYGFSILRLNKEGTKAVFYVDKSNETYWYDIKTKSISRINLVNDDKISDFELSPDGSKIAYAIINWNKSESGYWERYNLYLQNTDGSGRTLITDSALITKTYRRHFQFSGDNSALIYQAGWSNNLDYNIYLYSIANKETRKLTNDFNYKYHLNLSPDGKKIAYILDNIIDQNKPKQLMILNLENGDLRKAWQVEGKEPALPLWKGNSEDLFFVSKKDFSILQYNYISGTTKLFYTLSPDDTRGIVEIYYY